MATTRRGLGLGWSPYRPANCQGSPDARTVWNSFQAEHVGEAGALCFGAVATSHSLPPHRFNTWRARILTASTQVPTAAAREFMNRDSLISVSTQWDPLCELHFR